MQPRHYALGPYLLGKTGCWKRAAYRSGRPTLHVQIVGVDQPERPANKYGETQASGLNGEVRLIM